MSGSYWRFGNGYNDTSPLNTLLEKGFIEKESKTSSLNRQRKKSESSIDSQDSSSTNDEGEINANEENDPLENVDDDDEDEEEDDDEDDDTEQTLIPNLSILGEILDEQDILEELAGSNIKLIEYLRNPEVLEQLVDYITTEENDIADGTDAKESDSYKGISSDSSDSDDANSSEQKETLRETHSRRAQVAAEVLSADAWSLTDSFIENQDLLGKLWGILDKPCPLSMILSTYFMKINEHLLDMKIDEMLNFLLHQTNLVDRFLKHIDNPPLMDFLLKVISTDKPDNPTGIIDLLKQQNLIPKLISFLDPEVHSSTQSAAGDFIKAFVTISANSNTDNNTIGPNELTRELVSEPVMEQLSELMLNGGTSLSNGVGIIIEIIRKNNSDYDFVPVLFITIESHPPTSRDPIYLGHLIKVFSTKIPLFTKIIEDTHLESLETPFGAIEPLGFERFKICELVAELLHCSNMGLLNDESGEDIVRERDIERERLIALEQQEQNLHYDYENEVSRDISRLSISLPEDESNPTVNQDSIEKEKGEENDDDQDGEEDTDGHETTGSSDSGKSTDVEDTLESEKNVDTEKKQDGETEKTSNESNEDTSAPVEYSHKPHLESEPDSDDVDTTLEIRYDENESLLRKDPVVGDQLKIALADNSVILNILKMFFRFPWNNFLHNVVFDIVQQILNGSMEIGYNKYLAIDLFGRGHITELIIDGQQKCEEHQLETGLRLGYMGHLTLIAEEVVKFTALYPPSSIHEIILDAVSKEEWTIYVTETLVETREKYNALLGGGVEEEPDVDNGGNQMEKKGLSLDPSVDHDIGFKEDNEEDGGDTTFSRYMSQQLTNDLPDKFGSSDEDEDEDDLVGWNNQQYASKQLKVDDDDDDDYVDPNDDGQSYTKKNHPLYNDLTSPISNPSYGNGIYGEEIDNEDSSSSDDDDDDDDDSQHNDDDDYREETNGLTRSKSRGELSWDEDEQNRFLNIASYIQSQSSSSE